MESKPELRLEKSRGFWHLFIGPMHEPELCPECISPGIWKVEEREDLDDEE